MSTKDRASVLHKQHEGQRRASGLPAPPSDPAPARARVPWWLWVVLAVGLLAVALVLTR